MDFGEKMPRHGRVNKVHRCIPDLPPLTMPKPIPRMGGESVFGQKSMPLLDLGDQSSAMRKEAKSSKHSEDCYKGGAKEWNRKFEIISVSDSSSSTDTSDTELGNSLSSTDSEGGMSNLLGSRSSPQSKNGMELIATPAISAAESCRWRQDSDDSSSTSPSLSNHIGGENERAEKVGTLSLVPKLYDTLMIPPSEGALLRKKNKGQLLPQLGASLGVQLRLQQLHPTCSLPWTLYISGPMDKVAEAKSIIEKLFLTPSSINQEADKVTASLPGVKNSAQEHEENNFPQAAEAVASKRRDVEVICGLSIRALYGWTQMLERSFLFRGETAAHGFIRHVRRETLKMGHSVKLRYIGDESRLKMTLGSERAPDGALPEEDTEKLLDMIMKLAGATSVNEN